MNAVEAGGLMRTLRLYMETIPGLDQAATIDRLLTRAQLDPDVAKHLLSAPVDPQKHTRWNKQLFPLTGVAAAGRDNGRDANVLDPHIVTDRTCGVSCKGGAVRVEPSSRRT